MTQNTHPAIDAQQLVGQWKLDPTRTTVRFTHKTMWGLVTVKGSFDAIEGAGQVENDATLAGSMTVDAASIDTANQKRDEHLRSREFLDIETFPTIHVRVISGRLRNEPQQWRAELVVKGIAASQALTATVVSSTHDVITLAVDAAIDRDTFKMSWNKAGMLKGLAALQVNATFVRVA